MAIKNLVAVVWLFMAESIRMKFQTGQYVRMLDSRAVIGIGVKAVMILRILGAALILVAGCSPKKDVHAALSLTMLNKTGENVDETVLVLGQRSCTFGVVSVLGPASYAFWEGPVPTNVVVQWKDSKSTSHEAQVSLVGIYNPGIAGELVFVIGPTNVTVDFKQKSTR